jgi:two-component system LytT family response regulator
LQTSAHRFLESQENYQQQLDLLKNIMHNIYVPSADEFRLALPTKEGVHFLMPNEIIRCEAVGNYTKFFTDKNRTYLISKTLGE